MLALVLASVLTQDNVQAKAVWNTQKDAVWQIQAKYKGYWYPLGTGTTIKHGTRFYMVTAKHVADAKIKVSKEDELPRYDSFDSFRASLNGKVFTVSFKAMSDQDIAAARINPVEKYATISIRKPEMGDPVYSIGYPERQDKVLSEGIVNQFVKFPGEGQLIGFSAGTWYGNSGGSLFDAYAEVIGVVVAKWKDAAHLFYAEPCGDGFKKFLVGL
jgi:S1-C subfamily serine protease